MSKEIEHFIKTSKVRHSTEKSKGAVAAKSKERLIVVQAVSIFRHLVI